MLTKSAIAKGKELENYIADQLVEKGLDLKACRSHGSGNGNREKADIWTSLTILGRNVGIEAKNHAIPHIKDWWQQACKLEKLDREPILVYKLKGEGLGEAKAVVYLDTLLEMAKCSKERSNDEIKPTNVLIKRELLWLIKSGIEILKKIIKELEKIVN